MTEAIFGRYKGSVWHRFKLLIRGLLGLMFCIPLFLMTLFFILLELGNRTMDIILEAEEL